MTENERCIRCGREVDIDSDEFSYGEATEDGEYVCENCLTDREQQDIATDTAALANALDSAGLSNADLESMDETEYEMRENLAELLYEHDRPAER